PPRPSRRRRPWCSRTSARRESRRRPGSGCRVSGTPSPRRGKPLHHGGHGGHGGKPVCSSASSASSVVAISTASPKVALSTEQFSDSSEQVSQPERFRQPHTSALFEERLGVGAGDVTGHEDHPLGELRLRRGKPSIERLAV